MPIGLTSRRAGCIRESQFCGVGHVPCRAFRVAAVWRSGCRHRVGRAHCRRRSRSGCSHRGASAAGPAGRVRRRVGQPAGRSGGAELGGGGVRHGCVGGGEQAGPGGIPGHAGRALERHRVAGGPAPSPKPPLPPSPADVLYAVATVSAVDAWAVGGAGEMSGQMAAGLAEHWNGRHWVAATIPRLREGGQLEGVAAVSAREVWAVGSGGVTSAYGSQVAYALRWDGHGGRGCRCRCLACSTG